MFDDKIPLQLAVIMVEIFAVYLERGKTKIQFDAFLGMQACVSREIGCFPFFPRNFKKYNSLSFLNCILSSGNSNKQGNFLSSLGNNVKSAQKVKVLANYY